MDDMTYAVADAMAHNVKKAQEQAWAWHNLAKQLEAQVAQLQQQLAVAEAQKAGLVGQIVALKAAHPNSHLLVQNGPVYQNGQFKGQRKSQLRLAYEKAHDEAARKMNISDPVAVRDN